MKLKDNNGFTIIETLIATAIFALVLTGVTAIVIHITELYYKGINQSSTQDTTRNVLNDISQAIEFGGQAVADTSSYATINPGQSYDFCIGDQRYSYQLGYEAEPNPSSLPATYQTNNALVVDNNQNCRLNNALNLSTSLAGSSSRDLIGSNMRLVKLSVVPYSVVTNSLNQYQNQAYQIDVRIVYGDSDLLCAPTLYPASCNSGATITNASYLLDPDLTCKVSAGSQFCAVSELSTVVARRLQ